MSVFLFHSSWADGATTLFCMAGIVLVVQPPFLFRESGDGIPAYAAFVTLFGSCCAAMGMVVIRMIGPSIDPHVLGQSPESFDIVPSDQTDTS